MKPTVNICDGCCCGRVNKSNMAVPQDELKALWKENNLSQHVNLRSLPASDRAAMPT